MEKACDYERTEEFRLAHSKSVHGIVYGESGDGVGESNLSELKEETQCSERAAVQLALHDITDITDDRRPPAPSSVSPFVHSPSKLNNLILSHELHTVI